MLQADTTKFNFTPDETIHDKGFTVNVKKEMYRFPSILLLDLAIVYQCTGETSWETATELITKGNVPKHLGNELKFLLACACFIRLSAYLFHDSKDNRVSVAPESAMLNREKGSRIESNHKTWFTPIGLYLEFCETLLFIRRQISFLILSQLGTVPSEINMHLMKEEKHWCSRLFALHSAGRYIEAFGLLSKHMGKELHPDTATSFFPNDIAHLKILKTINHILSRCSRHAESLTFALHIDDIESSEQSKIRLSVCYSALGEFEKALKVLMTFDDEHKTANTYYALGRVHRQLEKYDEAEDYMVKSLQLFYNEAADDFHYDYYGDVIPKPKTIRENHTRPDIINCSAEKRLGLIRTANSDIVNCLRQLSATYWQKKDWALHHAYNDKVIAMLPSVYGDKALVWHTAKMNNMQGIHYIMVKNYKKAEGYLLESLSLYTEMYGPDTDDTNIALELSNIGYLYIQSGEYGKAKELTEKALSMYIRVFGEKSTHEDLCRTMRNLGDIHNHLGDKAKAVEYYEQPLSMLIQQHGKGIDHPDVADAKTRLGRIFINTNQLSKARNSLDQALAMYHRIHGTGANHADIIVVLKEFGRSHFSEENYKTALDYFETELVMYKQLHSNDECSVDLADTIQRIGSCYNKMNSHVVAETHMQQALDMNRKIYRNQKNHEDIATILKTLGDINFKMGNHEKAEEYYSEAFEIYSDLHGSDISHEGIAALSDALEANLQKKNS